MARRTSIDPSLSYLGVEICRVVWCSVFEAGRDWLGWKEVKMIGVKIGSHISRQLVFQHDVGVVNHDSEDAGRTVGSLERGKRSSDIFAAGAILGEFVHGTKGEFPLEPLPVCFPSRWWA